MQRAADVFLAYSMVVLGDGVEFANVIHTRQPEGVGAVEHERVRRIIHTVLERDPRTQFFGYICIGDSQVLSPTEIRRRIRLWKELGVSGVMLDEAGYDWQIVTRRRQNDAIHFAHSLGITVFLNAYYPTSLLNEAHQAHKNPTDEPIALLANDTILLESFPVKNGVYETTSEWRTRLDQALEVRGRFGSRIVTLATAQGQRPLADEQLEYACWNAWMFDLDGVAWGASNFSSDNDLPERSCDLLAAPPSKGRRQMADARADQLFLRESSEGTVVLDADRKTVHLQRGDLRVSQHPPLAIDETRQRNAISR